MDPNSADDVTDGDNSSGEARSLSSTEDTLAQHGRTPISVKALLILGVVAVLAYLLDQSTKFLVVENMAEGEIIRVFDGILQWHFVRNPGAAFSLASGSTWIFSILAAAVVVFLIWFARRIRSLTWAVVFGMLLGGVLGNLTDRLFRDPGFGVGHVVDFISTPWMIPAIYNVADMCIVISMGIFMILTIRGVRLDGTRETSEKTATTTEIAS